MIYRITKSLLLRQLLLLLGIAVARANAAEQAKLNLFIWSDYIDPALVKQFEQRHACKVTVDLYEDAESMLAKLQGGGDSLYDVVVAPDHMIKPMLKLQLLAPLRHQNITNLANLDPSFRNPPYDRGNKFTVAYQWGTVGIFAKRDKTLSQTWGLIFDPKQQPGPFLLVDSVRDTLGAALKYQGHSFNSTNISELKAARQLVLDAKGRSSGFEGSVGAKNKVLAGNVRCAIVYNGEGVRGMQENKGTIFFIPTEGSQIWLDNMVIMARAPHRDLAEKFLNFMLEPEVGARLSSFTQFASPNKASVPYLRPEDVANPAIYPPEEVRKKLEFLEDLGSSTTLYDEIWTQIKAH